MFTPRILWALPVGLALTFGILPRPAEAACDIGECNPQVCDAWSPAWTINDFPAHQTDTTSEQRDMVGQIARHVADSQTSSQPIVCLRLIGHASSFRNISADEYDRRARVRGETIAQMLTDTLEGHALRAFTVDRDDIDNDDAFCGEVLGSDVTLIFDGRGNACPLVDNMVNSSSSSARANRAINRRVSIYALRAAAPIEQPEAPDTPPQCNEERGICIIRHWSATEGLACWTPGNMWESPDDLRQEVRDGDAELVCGEM